MPRNRTSKTVNVPQLPPQKIRFSFEHYDSDGDKYCLSKATQPQVKMALRRLKEISAMTHVEFRMQRTVFHAREVIWERTREPNGFPHDDLNHLEPFHFALLAVNGQKTRVFGAFDGETFYIVWFDLNHEIWPSALKHT